MKKELSNIINCPEVKLAKWAKRRNIDVVEIMQKASDYQTRLYNSLQSKNPHPHLTFDETINKNSYKLAKIYYKLKN